MQLDNDGANDQPGPQEKVGYGSPPAASRFKKGVSGNLRGRPKGSLNVNTALTRVLRERVTINEHGQRKSITKLEAALKQLAQKAITGDVRAIREIVVLAAQAESKQALPAQQLSDLSDFDQAVIEGIVKR